MNAEQILQAIHVLARQEHELHLQYQVAYQELRHADAQAIEQQMYAVMRERAALDRQLQAAQDEQLDAEQVAARQEYMRVYTR